MDTAVALKPFVRRAALGESLWYQEHLVTVLADSASTGGQFGLMELFSRAGGEPLPHIHTLDDIGYYILDGGMEFTLGADGSREVIAAKPGDFVYLPKGLLISFRFTLPETRVLALSVPAGLEDAFRQLSRPAEALTLPQVSGEPLDIPHILQVFADQGMRFFPPAM